METTKLPRQRIVFIGDPSVGKSSIIYKYLNNRFEKSIYSTIGADFQIKTFEFKKKKFDFEIWDISSGSDRFRTNNTPMYRLADGIILCFDLSNLNSFKNLTDYWFLDFQNFYEKLSVIIVGTKSDLIKREVNEDLIEKFKNENKLKYFEISSKTGENIDEMMIYFFEHLILKKEKKMIENEELKEEEENIEKIEEINFTCILL